MQQSARAVMMVEPNFFQFNSDAALDNAYMKEPDSADNINEQVSCLLFTRSSNNVSIL